MCAIGEFNGYSSFVADKNLPAIAHSLLKNKHKLVVWGGTHNFTFHEWQRQTPAEFVVDTQWGWWNNKRLHGLEVCSPSEIAGLSVRRTIVSSNYYYGPASHKIDTYLARLGHFRTIKPMPLHRMAQLIAENDGKKLQRNIDPKFVEQINRTLTDMLTAPADLHKRRPLPNLRELTGFFGSYDANSYLETSLPLLREKAASRYRPRARHVCLFIGALHPGGAERQICNLAFGLKRAGWTATVLVYKTGQAETSHYRQFLADAGVGYHVICPPESDDVVGDALAALQDVPQDIMLALWHVRAELVLQTLHAYKALRKLRPELLISYLDWQNSFSGLGGMLAGIPRLLMSGRNAAPVMFPHFYGAMTDSFKDIYRIALQQPGFTLSNNSDWGGESYAQWLGVPAAKIPTVLNCVTETFRKQVPSAWAQIKRMQLNLDKTQVLILGVFRLSPEKHPLDFVRVIAALRRRHLRLRAIICGTGALEAEVQALIRHLKLDDNVTLYGVADDIHLMMRASTLLLHTSEAEGSPNAILEAQAIGLPVVCTDGGGVRACLAKSWIPYMKKLGDIDGLAAACHKLLSQPKLRSRLASKSRTAILRRFSIDALTRHTLVAAGLPAPRIAKTRD